MYNIAPEVEAFSTRRDSALPYPVVQAYQTHTTNVAVVDRAGITREDLEGIDALITNKRGVAIGARTADCIPVLLYDPVHHAVGAVHSGWRGTVACISSAALAKMSEVYGSQPADMKAVIGPGIGADAFQVGDELVDAFRAAAFPMDDVCSWRGPRVEGSLDGGFHIDLAACVRGTLLEAGIPADSIQVCGICTYKDGSFFSARREGVGCGRIINSIMLK